MVRICQFFFPKLETFDQVLLQEKREMLRFSSSKFISFLFPFNRSSKGFSCALRSLLSPHRALQFVNVERNRTEEGNVYLLYRKND